MSSLSQEVDAANVAATATAAAAALGTIHILRKHLSQGGQTFQNVSKPCPSNVQKYPKVS